MGRSGPPAGHAPGGPHVRIGSPPAAELQVNLTLHVWRQPGPGAAGRFERYEALNVSDHMSFLELLDVVNADLIGQGKEPIAFEHDCREGICGSCGMVINGEPHGPQDKVTVCQ